MLSVDTGSWASERRLEKLDHNYKANKSDSEILKFKKKTEVSRLEAYVCIAVTN